MWCSIDGCGQLEFNRGWCQKHYHRWWRHGDPTAGRIANGSSIFFRFFDKVLVGDGCWEWQGYCDVDGYGRFKGEEQMAPRMAWRLWYGLIPDGMHVLHKCDHPPCVRPDHLFLGTPLDNAKDRDAKGRHHLARTAESPH